MLNKKFLTRLLNDSFRKQTLLKNHKFIESKQLKLKAYATYVVDKYVNDRDKAFIDVKEANYGYSPLEVLAYAAEDGSIQTAFFEFNTVSHFLKENAREKAVEVVECILSELAIECKGKIASFDIDKIDVYLKKLEQEYLKQQEEQAKKAKEDESKKIHKTTDS